MLRRAICGVLLSALCLGSPLAQENGTPSPWYKLNADDLKTIGEVGVDVAIGAYPPFAALEGVKKAYDVSMTVVEAATQAVDARTSVKQNDLLAISKDARYLNDLAASGQNWRDDPKGREAHAQLETYMKQDDGAFSFAAKAMALNGGIYSTFKNLGADAIGEYFGKMLANSRIASKYVHFGATPDGVIREQLTRAQWKKLATVVSKAGKFNERLNRKLREKILGKALGALTRASLDTVIDNVAAKVLAEHPHIDVGNGSADLRLDILNMPELGVPGLHATPYEDPVLRPIELQRDLFEQAAPLIAIPAPSLSAPASVPAVPPPAPVYEPSYSEPAYQPREIRSVNPHVDIPSGNINWDSR